MIWQTLVLPRVGVQGDRPLKYTAGHCRCALGTLWVFTQGVGEVI